MVIERGLFYGFHIFQYLFNTLKPVHNVKLILVICLSYKPRGSDGFQLKLKIRRLFKTTAFRRW